MRHSLWSFAIIGLAVGSLAMVSGTAIGGEVGPLVVGYGLLVAAAAVYLVAALSIRERAWRRFSRTIGGSSEPGRLAGRRVF